MGQPAVSVAQLQVMGLLPSHLVNHCRQAIQILDNQITAPALDDTEPGEAVELAGHCLAMRTDAARDLGVCGCALDDCRVARLRHQSGESQDLGLNAIADGKRTKLVHTCREAAHFRYELA